MAMRDVKKDYEHFMTWELYSDYMETEYMQSMEEGLNIEKYEPLFKTVAAMPRGEMKDKFADLLYQLVMDAEQRDDFPFEEPSDLPGIKALRKPYDIPKKDLSVDEIRDHIHGGWVGRIVGCLLGKPFEWMLSTELVPFLKETGNYPMHRYLLTTDLTDEVVSHYSFKHNKNWCADAVDGMPVDDDTNYIIMGQQIINDYGRDFTAFDVSRAWMHYQRKDAYCTAERIAYCNFIKGYNPPVSGFYKNPYREWVGAQIRGDYFGYINPGNPEMAAEMAFRDASISHTKNGIYGEMFAAACIAVAAVTDNVEDILRGGLAQIPHTSRLYKALDDVINDFNAGVTLEDAVQKVHDAYDEFTEHGWCHTISNAMIVAISLLYSGGDYSKAICLAVQTGYDTDCNGATVGSILGMAVGRKAIPAVWTESLHDTLHTSIFGIDTVKISEKVELTMKHLA